MIIRILDFVFSLTLLILLFPLLILIIIIIIISSGFPVFFIQPRVGLNEKIFAFIKFRTMTVNNSANNGDSREYLSMNVNELKKIRSNYITTKKNDSRITNFGKFLRKYSLDELPQLYNVLLSDMSLVGPRPDPPIQKADYSEIQWIERCQVKPGITGLAQIRGRSESTEKERISNDLFWVKNKSFNLYMKILLFTPFALIKDTN